MDINLLQLNNELSKLNKKQSIEIFKILIENKDFTYSIENNNLLFILNKQPIEILEKIYSAIIYKNELFEGNRIT